MTKPSGRNPLFIGNAFATSEPEAIINIAIVAVAIPYSSGMLLLHPTEAVYLIDEAAGRNPLFIGNAFATLRYRKRQAWGLGVAIPYSSGMLLLQHNKWAVGSRGSCRNPLFIGNAFATNT